MRAKIPDRRVRRNLGPAGCAGGYPVTSLSLCFGCLCLSFSLCEVVRLSSSLHMSRSLEEIMSPTLRAESEEQSDVEHAPGRKMYTHTCCLLVRKGTAVSTAQYY